MIKQHSHLMNFSLGLADQIVATGSFYLAYQMRFGLFPYRHLPALGELFQCLVLVGLVSLLVFLGMGLYRPRRDQSFLLEIGLIFRASLLSWGILVVLLYFLQQAGPFTRGMLVAFLPIFAMSMIVERGFFRAVLRYLRRRGWNQRHALIVGTGRMAQKTLAKLHSNSWTGIRVRGFVDLRQGKTSICDLPVLGTIEELVELVDAQEIDCVFVAVAVKHGALLRSIVQQLEQTAAEIKIIPDYNFSSYPLNLTVTDLDGLPILSLRETPLCGWSAVYKRLFDLFGALVALTLFGPVMLLIAAAVKVTSPGPVFYRQRRVSLGGRPFFMLKFRSMRLDAESNGPAFTQPGDSRCTRLGQWLRSTSLDELPQLFNVLLGHMSLVGPRPERPEMMSKLRHQVHGYPLRLGIRAGLTGYAQIHGFRGRTCFRKRLQYDLYYLTHWSPLLDLQIVLATFWRGFRHPNAY